MSQELLKGEERFNNFGPNLLVFVRHAQSERNLAKGESVKFPDQAAIDQIKGIPSYLVELTEEGRKQAKDTGRMLVDRFGDFDRVYHSGYVSTVQTTEELLSAYSEKPEVVTDFMIRERDQGFTYEMTSGEIKGSFPWLEQYWNTFGRFYGRAPGSENLIHVAHRARYFLDNIFRFRDEKSVLIVTHAGTLQAFRFLMEGWSFEEADKFMAEQKPGNCAILAYGSTETNRRLSLGLEKPELLNLGYRL